MPRNSSGVYTLPEASFQVGTTIQSAPMNSNLSDIASTLTLSLASTGVTTMTGPIKAASGSVTAPSYTFGTATGTGFYLSGANAISWTAAGVLAATFAADGSVTWVGTQTFSSATFTSATFTSGIRVGFSGAPTADRIEVGDATFYMDGSNSALPLIAFDSNDFISYTRATDTYSNVIAGTTIFAISPTAISPKKNLSLDAGIIVLATAGYSDFVEIAAPSVPAANTGRLYTRDINSGTTIFAYQDSAGTERLLLPPARAYGEYTDSATLSATIPLDDSIPQDSEGTEILSAAITLNKSNSRVRIRFTGQVTGITGSPNYAVAALFRDGTASALSTTFTICRFNTPGPLPQLISIIYEEAPGSVGPFTYAINVGPDATSGGTLQLNGLTSGRLFGGTSKATLVVEEVYV